MPRCIRWHAGDGDRIAPDQLLCEIEGDAPALLSAERSALNFLQLLSGVASKARQYADVVAGTRAVVVDTRKTIPRPAAGAEICGEVRRRREPPYRALRRHPDQGKHILAAGGIRPRWPPPAPLPPPPAPAASFVQIEVESLAELREALAAGATMVPARQHESRRHARSRTHRRWPGGVEALGRRRPRTLRAIAETGGTASRSAG